MLTTQFGAQRAGVTSEDGRRGLLVKHGSSEQLNPRRRHCLSVRCAAEIKALVAETSRRLPQCEKQTAAGAAAAKNTFPQADLAVCALLPLSCKDDGGLEGHHFTYK